MYYDYNDFILALYISSIGDIIGLIGKYKNEVGIVAENKEKRYVSDNAQLMAEWNWERNTEFDPSQLTLGSNKKMWWKCNKGHEWQASIAHRNNGRKCPYCSGRKTLKGYNDLPTINPTLALEWNYEKNGDLKPENFTASSGITVWWKCAKGHEWQAPIYNRNNERGCPYCSSKKILKGYNDLQTTNPSLAKEWNYEKNNGLAPEHFSAGSKKKVWWRCINGHEWQATITNRNNERGCPYCSGKKVLKGYNDLQTVNPSLAKEWNYEKNGNIKPEHVTISSGKKAWWKCSKGHEWIATIAHRNNGRGCPYCSSKKVLNGYNDLHTINPYLAKEWNYEKNGNLKPENFTANSNKKVWWICNKGHEWQSTINHRSNNRGCPVCNSERSTSFPEYAILYYLKKYGLDVIHSYNEKGYELDIYIPSMKIAIEYDGYYWHKNKAKKDLAKNQKCQKDGIKLYRIREALPSLNDSSIDYVVQENQEDLPKILKEILGKIIGTNIDIDIKRDYIAIENLREYTEKENSLLFSNPEIAREWNYEKNGNLKPEHFAANSNKKVWWICNKGHEWQASISHRNNGTKCPYCSGRYAVKGENDLLTANPTLAEQWNYKRNNNLKPENFTVGSGAKVWWICSKGHEWQATISTRKLGRGCPYCSGRYAIKGETDLQTINPTLTKEWNYKKNGNLKPELFTANSGQKVWWICNKGHEWQATIGSRNRGSGCPECRKTKSKG